MFQKLWKFPQTGTSQASQPQDHGVSTKVKPIHASFNKGIPLNMKIVIRGDIRTGKTSVFERLQGHPFRNENDYSTTSQIQVANIPWQYPHTKDIIKVEVWDVVDRGVQSISVNAPITLKVDNTPNSGLPVELAPHAGFSLDASTIDVYRNTDGVVLLYDASKPWTLDYASKALTEIPVSMPVMILSNFTDDNHSRAVATSDRVDELLKEHNDIRRKQPNAPANLIRHLDVSMKTGLGLKEIHESLGIPFLNVLRETHRKQFEQKTQEIEVLLKGLDRLTQQRPQTGLQRQPPKQINDTQPLSPKDTVSSPPSIQTTGAALRSIPQTSSPTSPSRKTRNEYTNVDILSPTPVPAQAPAVLFDIHPEKLDEGFFRNVDLCQSAPGTADKNQGESLHAHLTYQVASSNHEIQVLGNPMVAGDEDIEDGNEDDQADVPFQEPVPVRAPVHAEKDLLSHNMVRGKSEEQEEEDVEIQDDGYGHLRHGDDDYAEMAEDSANSTLESIPPLRHTLQQDSDIESQPDIPIASAMYYEHERSAFVQEHDLQLIGEPRHPLNSISHSLGGYEEIGDHHLDNPWESTGDLLSGITVLAKAGVGVGHESMDEQERHKAQMDSTARNQTPPAFPDTEGHIGDSDNVLDEEDDAGVSAAGSSDRKKTKKRTKRKGKRSK
ncbi:Rab-like protein 6 [Mortierella sp. GBA43]|nr:Rab-like protein 6 [Mortierella sp. GBA43]